MTAKAKIILVVTTCFLLDSSAAFSNAGFAADSPVRTTLGPAIFQLVTLVSLPFTILAGLTQEVSFSPEYKLPSTPKPSSRHAARNEKDSICPENAVVATRVNADADKGGRSLPATLRFSVYRSFVRTTNLSDTGPRSVPMAFLLIYLAILWASNLPWKAVLCPLDQARSRVRAAELFCYCSKRAAL